MRVAQQQGSAGLDFIRLSQSGQSADKGAGDIMRNNLISFVSRVFFSSFTEATYYKVEWPGWLVQFNMIILNISVRFL